jgi:carbon storage regulator
MLVLTRRVGEEIVIAGGIRVRVLAVKGPVVRVGITAPSFVRVLRLELLAGNSEGAGLLTTGRNGEPQDRGSTD